MRRLIAVVLSLASVGVVSWAVFAAPAGSNSAPNTLGVTVQPSSSGSSTTPNTPDTQATALPTLAGPSASLEVILNRLAAGSTQGLSSDPSVSMSSVSDFLQSMSDRLSGVQLVPSVSDTTAQPDGSSVLQFSVTTYLDGGVFPTSIGDLNATVSPDGTVYISHANLCQLVPAGSCKSPAASCRIGISTLF